MCKCECKKVENVEVTDEMMAAMLGCVFGEIISDIIDGIAEEDEAEVSISQNIDLEKEIENVVFNDPATIVFWKDGTKTVTKCHAGDTFNKETGLAMCIIRKLCNNKHFNNVFEKYCNIITVKQTIINALTNLKNVIQ